MSLKQPININRRMPYTGMNIKVIDSVCKSLLKFRRLQKELESLTMKTAVPIRFNGGQLPNIGMPPGNQDYDESVRS